MGRGGRKKECNIFSFPVGELLFWKVFLAKIHLLLKKNTEELHVWLFLGLFLSAQSYQELAPYS